MCRNRLKLAKKPQERHQLTQSFNFEHSQQICLMLSLFRHSPPEVFLGKGVLKICNNFTREHPCRSVISIKLLCSFIEIALHHMCSAVNLLHVFRIPFPRNTSGWLLLIFAENSNKNFLPLFYSLIVYTTLTLYFAMS